jgi:hypothetical protein
MEGSGSGSIPLTNGYGLKPVANREPNARGPDPVDVVPSFAREEGRVGDMLCTVKVTGYLDPVAL